MEPGAHPSCLTQCWGLAGDAVHYGFAPALAMQHQGFQALTLAALALLAGGRPAGAAEPAPPREPRSIHRMTLDIRGPLALVTVERSLAALVPGEAKAAEEGTLDLALPEGAAAVAWEVLDEARRVRLGETSVDRARAEHRSGLAAHAVGATRIPLDDGTDFRLHVAGVGRGARALLRYRYSAPLVCRDGRFVVRIPGSLEAEPIAADVSLTITGAAAGSRIADVELAGAPVARAGGATVRAKGRAPARAGWEVSFAVQAARPRFPAQVLAATGGTEPAVAVGVCRPPTGQGSLPPAPERVLLLIDRSRSVGPAGSVAERELARAVIEALPPSVRFNAIFFDRAAAPLFPVARSATAEALTALDSEIGPGQLRNGTDLPRALKIAADLVRADPDGPSVRTWLVVITDGALPEGQRSSALIEATAGLSPAHTDVLVLVVRPRADDPPTPSAISVLRALPARYGGVVRAMEPAELRTNAPEVVAAARQGGDLFALSVTGATASPSAVTAGAPGDPLTDGFAHLAPGQGQVRVLRGGRGGRLALSGRLGGEAVSASLRAAPVEASWLAPHAGRGATPAAWHGSSRRVSAWIERGPRATPPAGEPVVRGEMDRTVVRNALSLAFLPRARACYLTRRIRGGADLELRGRLRLELHLERGEMLDAQVRNSTLKRPDIEACLRDAAFGIEVPRPLHRDAPVVAALNLQFQPTTPPPGSSPDGSALSREIDLLIGPVSFPTDPRELLGEPISPAGAPSSR